MGILAIRDRWAVAASTRRAQAQAPAPEELERCWALARAIRAVADFLAAPSARADGENIPLFADREHGELYLAMPYADRRAVPSHLVQVARESW